LLSHHAPREKLVAMQIVHGPTEAAGVPRIRLEVDRLTLAKRRWRGVAADGTEFGFDLTEPLSDSAAFHATEAACYVIAQRPETVLEVRIADCGLRIGEAGARIGWMLGNLHFPIEIAEGLVRTGDDPAVRQLLERENVPFAVKTRVFQPTRGTPHEHRH
jgi:urease accessory protein